MCGFAVAINWPEAESVVGQVIQGILHRGDITDPIFAPSATTAMGTRRLRIVDAAHGTQPQLSFNGDLAVCFNGEIYNHVAIREELEALGVPFRTHSDTEVLANALQAWGYRALDRLNGMYAFVAVQMATGDFLAARDPFGVKPLYLIQSPTGFLFCSEMKPLLDAVPTGDVLLLPPGYALTRKACARFQSPVYPRLDKPVANDPKALDRILADAVAARMPPDLPAAILFSGGIDSTLVAHYARQVRAETPGYFVGSTNAPDFRYAADYAAQTGFDLRIAPFDAESDAVFDRIGEAVAVSESFEPNLIRGAICSMTAAEAMHKDGFRVGLCGEGADELFCGYVPLELAFADTASVTQGRAMREECLDLMHRVSLQRVDRCSMRYQVEMREPFLDPNVANYALGLDASALVSTIDGNPVGKMALRALYDLHAGHLPASIRDRSKMPFGEGSGLDVSPQGSKWKRRFDAAISDRDFADGKIEFAAFSVQSKEELFYLRKLAAVMDVARIPHLRDRAWITTAVASQTETLKHYAHARL